MKYFLFGIIALINSTLINAQNIDTAYKVTKYEINGESYGEVVAESDICLSFYMDDENVLCFKNHWRNNESQSYGKVNSFKTLEIEEANMTYATTKCIFTWSFSNSYDDKKGSAEVIIERFFIGNIERFKACILVHETNDVLVLKGYIE